MEKCQEFKKVTIFYSDRTLHTEKFNYFNNIIKMGIKEAAIYLDNQWNTYYAGQTVNGRVEYVFDSPKKVRGE